MEIEEILQESVKRYRPETEIISFKDVSGHENDTFIVKLPDEEVVCTLCTGNKSLESCRKELRINREIESRTEIPVPEIVYSECSESKFPSFYISRKVSGLNGQDLIEKRVSDKNRLNPKERKNLTRNIGRVMGELHREFVFSKAGEISVNKDKITVEKGSSFKKYFSDLLDDEIDDLESTKFSDVQQEVRETINRALDIIENPSENCMIHHDIRPDNMIIEGPKIQALLDFEHVTSGHPLIDYAHTEILVTEPHLYYDVEESELTVEELRQELKKGYLEENNLPDNFRVQSEIFKLIEHIRNMNSFRSYADSVGMSEKERRENLKEHKRKFMKMRCKISNPDQLNKILDFEK